MRLVLFFFAIFLFALPCSARAQFWQNGERGVVRHVIDGDEFILDSGLVVRLAQIEAPRILMDDDEGKNARDYLQNLILNKKIELKYGELRRDRMGRALAQAFIIGENEPIWVNIELLKSGHARVHSYKDNRKNMPDFWLAERQARREFLGLWQNPKYQARFATKPALIGAEGSFQLVEGQVTEIYQTPKTIRLEFSDNRETGFAAIIPQSSFDLFEGGKAGIMALKGMNIRVRGRVQGAVLARTLKSGKSYPAHGPQIWLDHPELIEYLMKK